MSTDHSAAYLTGLVRELCSLPRETEWLEFKVNNADPQEIGEYLSALANEASLCNQPRGYPNLIVAAAVAKAAGEAGRHILERGFARRSITSCRTCGEPAGSRTAAIGRNRSGCSPALILGKVRHD
jgi:hypothetical protein